MKITYYLDEAPSVITHKPNGMGQITYKVLDSGSLSRKPKAVTITDTTTGEVHKLKVDDIEPISSQIVFECNRMMAVDRLAVTLPEIVYAQKMALNATKGNNVKRYVVSEVY